MAHRSSRVLLVKADSVHQSDTNSTRPMLASSPAFEKPPAPILPAELLFNILSHLSRQPKIQPSLYSFCLVSRSWYAAGVYDLYRAPTLAGSRYLLFVRTVCPSINLHVRKNGLAALVRKLDMSRVVHEGSKSITGRLLGRVKGGLEEFVAPQTSFASNSLPPLSKCQSLRVLDLSRLSESIPVKDLLHTISPLAGLEVFHFPRCSPSGGQELYHFPPCSPTEECRECNALYQKADLHRWPHRLKSLHFTCAISPLYLPMFLNLPETLTNLTIEDGPLYREYPVNSILKCLGSQIINLRLMFGFPKIGLQSPSIILRFAPNIRHLSLVASDFFLGAYQSTSCTTRQIESLTLFAPRTGTISEDLFGQIFEDVDHSYLDHLRRVRVSNKLGWKPGDKRWKAIQDLGDFLQALHAEALEDGVTTEPEGEAGVWMFDEEDPVQQIQKSLWKP